MFAFRASISALGFGLVFFRIVFDSDVVAEITAFGHCEFCVFLAIPKSNQNKFTRAHTNLTIRNILTVILASIIATSFRLVAVFSILVVIAFSAPSTVALLFASSTIALSLAVFSVIDQGFHNTSNYASHLL
jgi:uncharacterized membrane protein